jgi:hypothetical protein
MESLDVASDVYVSFVPTEREEDMPRGGREVETSRCGARLRLNTKSTEGLVDNGGVVDNKRRKRVAQLMYKTERRRWVGPTDCEEYSGSEGVSERVSIDLRM